MIGVGKSRVIPLEHSPIVELPLLGLHGRSMARASPHQDREVQILKELNGHPNIVYLHGAFLSDVGKAEPKLNLVLEFLSDTLHRVLKHYNQQSKNMDEYYIKLYQYQLLRGLAYTHGKGILHCDVKPQNLLLDGGTHTLKVCDFGTAKRMSMGKHGVAYACSRYYRAPELILGATNYTPAVDLWSAGCVFAEMFIGQSWVCDGAQGISRKRSGSMAWGTMASLPCPSPAGFRRQRRRRVHACGRYLAAPSPIVNHAGRVCTSGALLFVSSKGGGAAVTVQAVGVGPRSRARLTPHRRTTH